MKIRRRLLTATPLLIACSGPAVVEETPKEGPVSTVSGNLIAPPRVLRCVDVLPEGVRAVIAIDGQEADGDGCANLTDVDPVKVIVYAKGYEEFKAMLYAKDAVAGDWTVTLTRRETPSEQ